MTRSIRSAASPQFRVRPRLGEKSLARQSMKDECDINQIVQKFTRTGLINHFAKYGGEYAVVDPISFHEAMTTVTRAEQMFQELPGKTRQRFGNDPAKFLAFVQDEKNLPEMRELGLAKPAAVGAKETPAPSSPPPVAPASPPAAPAASGGGSPP